MDARRILTALTCLTVALTLYCWPSSTTPAVAADPVADDAYLSPCSLAADAEGKRLYIAAATGRAILVYDIAKEEVASRIELPGPPTCVVAGKGETLYVTIGEPNGTLCVLSGDKVSKTIPVGHTPSSVTLSADEKTAFVCNRFDNTVSIVDLAGGTIQATVVVPREPVGAAISADGKSLFVANHLPATPADGEYAGAAVSVIDVAGGTIEKTINLPNGTTGVRDITISPDGKYVYVSQILARYQLPTTQLDRGWMNTNGVSILDVAGKAMVNTILLDNIDRGAANPWGIACSEDGKWLCVTHAGTHEVSLIDRGALHERLQQVAEGKAVTEVSDSKENVPNDLAFLVGIRKRVSLKGNGPRELTIVGNKAYAVQYFSDSLAVVDLDAKAAKEISLGSETPMNQVRTGEMYFNDASLCFQQWQSCASCHPEGRTDGLNWDLLNDGIGNPKQTKSMLLSHQTPPVMVSGVRGAAEVAVRAGIRFIQFAVRPEEDAQAIDAYLGSLKPVPNPHLTDDGKLSEAATRGKAIFDNAGCAGCHPAPLFTDLQSYDVGVGTGTEKGKAFDTPTLVEIWRTGPYLYDGRAATIVDVFKKFNPDGSHGDTQGLSEQDLSDLAEYVLSL